MTATNTTNKSLSEPASGDLNWDVNLNANFTTIDKAFGSFVNIATTTGNYALTTSDLQNMCLKSNTSAFTANVTYTIPNGVAGQWVVVNQSGVSSNTLSVVCGASSVLVDRGTVRSIYCDGTTVTYADTPFATAGSDTQVIYNSSGTLTGSANLKFNGTALLANAILDASGGNTATINGVIPGAATDKQVFTSSGTWTKPSAAKLVLVRLWGGGGGGGSGMVAAAGAATAGGGGGGGGGFLDTFIDASDLSATVTVTIGSGGTGGASAGTTASNGNNGSNGGTTSFGIYSTNAGGDAGAAFINNIGVLNASYSKGGSGTSPGGSGGGGYGYNTTNTVSISAAIAGYDVSSFYGSGGGGGGGGLTSANVSTIGAAGGGNTARGTSGGAAGASAGAAGSTGGTASGGGGGYGGSTSVNGGAGANGSAYGGGGGGGGGTRTTKLSGAGGTGGAGYAEIFSW